MIFSKDRNITARENSKLNGCKNSISTYLTYFEAQGSIIESFLEHVIQEMGCCRTSRKQQYNTKMG